ncbi:hypothetical protein VTN77DRAFT_561 [Rasamsonia byssochlamydoides]|uniref:uncharacterized protein n=1 Tax=Rasamsonia byssochlamydoides TaxID=89139 RepID=UPI003744A49A
MPRTWLITGCSSGFGQEIAKAALAAGDIVVATSREASRLGHLQQLGAIPVSLDVTGTDQHIEAVVAEAVKKAGTGTIDILVNNAGYLLEGAVEEISSDEAKAQFDTNVFGVLAVTRAVLPYMRARRSGVIANMGSIAGWDGGINYGLYSAAKFALVGASLALREEVKSFGIQVTVIEPGYFRTNFLSTGGGHKVTARKVIDELRPIIDPVKEALAKCHHQQPGDPAKGAQLIVEALTGTGRCPGRRLPRRLALGSDAVAFIEGVLQREKDELEEWKELSITTDFV